VRKTFLFLLILTGLHAFSQDKNSFISLQGGASFPIGNYASTNLDYGSFTTTGINAGIEGAWFFLPYLGVGGQVGINYHPIDVSMLGWEKVKANPFLEDLSIRSDSYQIATGAIGLYGKWNFWNKLSFTGKVLGGIMWGKSPYQLYKPTYYQVEPKWYEITSATDFSAMLVAGAGLRYDISGCIGLKADADYTFGQMVYGFRTATGTRYDYRDITYINLTLGLVVIL